MRGEILELEYLELRSRASRSRPAISIVNRPTSQVAPLVSSAGWGNTLESSLQGTEEPVSALGPYMPARTCAPIRAMVLTAASVPRLSPGGWLALSSIYRRSRSRADE